MAALPLPEVDSRHTPRPRDKGIGQDAQLGARRSASPRSQAQNKNDDSEAVEAFLDDEQGRHLRRSTTGQSKTLLSKQLLAWVWEHGLEYLDELTAAVLSKFRVSWSNDLGNAQNTARRKHERLCGFFHFCIRNE